MVGSGKETSRSSAETSAIPSSSALSISAKGNKSQSDAAPLVGTYTAPVQVPEPLDRKEIVLGLPAPSAAPLPKGRKRNGAATETAIKRRCAKGAEGEPSVPLPQYRAKVERLTEGLAESREALKRIEATHKSTEDAHTGETS
ncbi:hypothetical protein F2Q70_00035109 [Brassica cretica]|uniref:Uncharacterized protein n=1 Tax=Brassica cretica TaxID=69181 RepID=A0A8S9JR92_BRACR|nr:hypothetical protein F2Q70_00035109 [Brassica cretica]